MESGNGEGLRIGVSKRGLFTQGASWPEAELGSKVGGRAGQPGWLQQGQLAGTLTRIAVKRPHRNQGP